jgi:hypothetical protein
LIVLSHVTGSPIPSNLRQVITANTFVGYLCLSNEAFNTCEVFANSVPTHLAFQLLFFSGTYQQAPNDILGYLARPNCLYDGWNYNQGNPQVQINPIRACP